MRSPCLTCEYQDRDKNHPECVNCQERLRYAAENDMYDPRAKKRILEGQDTMVLFGSDTRRTYRPTICTQEGCDDPVKALGLCGYHYYRQYRERKKNANL